MISYGDSLEHYSYCLFIFVTMQKSPSQLNGTQFSRTQNRNQEFSFVNSGLQGHVSSLRIDSNLQLARKQRPVQERNFEITFQNKPGSIVSSFQLKRESNNYGKKSYQMGFKEEEKLEQYAQRTKPTRGLEDQADRTVHSSSSDGYEGEKRVAESSQSSTSGRIQPKKTQRLSRIVKKSDSHQFIELNCELPDVYESEILLNKGIEDYLPDHANICGGDFIEFSKYRLSLVGLIKIKICPVIVKKKSFRIKLTHADGIFNMGLELRRELYYLPEHYIWFAKLVNARLIRSGGLGSEGLGKGSGTGTLHRNGIFNQGLIYKCSKYRKKWEKRFILINNEGLFSYKNPKENYTIHIPTNTIEELWTNFEIFSSCLVIKIKHKGEKTDFAIPILDYCLKEDSLNWLFSFYRLLMEHKIHIKV